jgi:hypothetical protein
MLSSPAFGKSLVSSHADVERARVPIVVHDVHARLVGKDRVADSLPHTAGIIVCTV